MKAGLSGLSRGGATGDQIKEAAIIAMSAACPPGYGLHVTSSSLPGAPRPVDVPCVLHVLGIFLVEGALHLSSFNSSFALLKF